MDDKDPTTLTSFNFDLSETDTDDEGTLSKILNKVKSAVSGQPSTGSGSQGNDRDSISSKKSASLSRAQRSQSSLSTVIQEASGTHSDEKQEPNSRSASKRHIYVTAPTSPPSYKETTYHSFPRPSVSSSQTSIRAPSSIAVSTVNASGVQDVDATDNFLPIGAPLRKSTSFDSDAQSISTTFSLSTSHSLNRIIARLRGQKSDKEFWMSDEQCKECYKCRKPFKLLRRRHHCRICGQIFCGKCASHRISGKLYKQKGEVRVCNFCYREHHIANLEATMHDPLSDGRNVMQPDYSSEPPVPGPEHAQKASGDLESMSGTTETADEQQPIIPSQLPPIAAPKMHIPTKVVKQPYSQYGDSDATTVALEFLTSSSAPLLNVSAPHDTPQSRSQQRAGGLISRSNSVSAAADGEKEDGNGDGGLRRLLDAGTSLLKSRSRSNTSSSFNMEEGRQTTQFASPAPLRGYTASPNLYMDRGGGTLVSERELSPFMVHVDDEEDGEHMGYQLYEFYNRPPNSSVVGSFRMPPAGSNQSQAAISGATSTRNAVKTTAGSDDDLSDSRPRDRRTEELRGHVGPVERSVSTSFRRQSFGGYSGSRKRPGGCQCSMRIDTSNLPKPDYSLLQNEGRSPSPFMSPFDDKYAMIPRDHNTIKSRLLTQRRRRISAPQPNVESPSNVESPPNIELSDGAQMHARKMLRQLMCDASFSELSAQAKSEWEEIITKLILKVTENVRPDVRSGDDMDIRHYIKIKKVPGGSPSDSFYVKGVMCTKNVAHKKMMRNIAQPRILILLFSLEYSRADMDDQLMSIDPVISQEREHISKLVARITALRPSLLLVKSTVSRIALEYLLEARIPVIHNVKESVIYAVARCTRATILTSIDKLQSGDLSFGQCGSFEIRTLMHDWIPNRRKTYLIFDDCQPDLGGTIVLRGARLEILRLIKRLIDFMVFVVNNLKLESSLLRDLDQKEPEADESKPISRNRSPLVPSEVDSSSELPASAHVSPEDMGEPQTLSEDDAVTLDKSIKLYRDTVLSASQFVVFPEPYLLTQLKETTEKLAALNASRKAAAKGIHEPRPSPAAKGNLEKQATSSQNDPIRSPDSANPATHAEYERLVVKRNQLMRAWSAYLRESSDHINPFYHQNIVVLYSNVCTVTTVPCHGPEIRIFEYYSHPSDMPLGHYIAELCREAMQPCTSRICEEPVHRHYRSYAHGNARITVMIEQFPCPRPGMSDKILMWSYCSKCDKPTPVKPMSENTWSYSFGKFLEVCLYQKGVHCGADICPHDIGRHHVRYFGYMDFAVRFQYERIDLLEVAVPPMKLFMLSQVQIDLKEAELKSLRSKINKYYQSMAERNKAFPFDLVDPKKLEACKNELQAMTHRCDSEKKQVLQILQNVYATSEPNDTLTMNWVRRILYQQIAQWDLEYADLVRNYLQPERELRKITASHLRKVFPPDMAGEAITDIDGERAKRATEMTDLPLLGTELDENGFMAMLSYSNGPPLLPRLSCSPTDQSCIDMGHLDSVVQSSKEDGYEGDAKHSFLRPEVRRRLSLELMRELNTRLGSDDANGRDKEASVSNAKTKASSISSSTPSRIPVLHLGHQNKAKLSPPLYDVSSLSYHSRSHRRPSVLAEVATGDLSRRKTVLPDYRYSLSSSLLLEGEHSRGSNSHSFSGSRPSFAANKRHSLQPVRQGLGRSHYGDDSSLERKVQDGITRRGLSARERHFRSRLPRKKTSMQVYTRVNDLVKEEMEDEFMVNDTEEATDDERCVNRIDILKKPATMVDNTRDEESAAVDYFSPMAPYSNRMNDIGSSSFLSQRYQGVPEAITGFGMELERHPPPAVDLLEPPPANIIAGVSSSDIHSHEDSGESSENGGAVENEAAETVDDALDDGKYQPEKSSFMKTITSFLTDSGVANLMPLEYPLQPTEHIFPDSFVVVREDEPSTIIAYTLSCEDYLMKLHGMPDSASEISADDISTAAHPAGLSSDFTVKTETSSDTVTISGGAGPSAPSADIQETLLRESGIHMGYSFRSGSTKFFCKIFFVEQFDALRRNCGCDESYIYSLASCVKWDSSGGKSGSAFLKTKDDRLLMKQVSRFELDAFLGFAPAYFQYMSEAFFRELPTVLAKIFGFYSIGYKNTATGKSMRMDVLVMENLFYQRKIKQIFDLKGSMRNRHVQSTGKQDEVLLDENLVELIYQSPLFIRAHSKEILRSSLHNDTLFLCNRNVMDYSLLVGIDDERQELVVGIVDFIRTFTWDKKLESWVKESGIFGGGGKEPTIVSPKQYRIRFKEAMERYFLMVPDEWSLTRQTRALFAGVYHHHQPVESSSQNHALEND